jgi:hypothetical protein
MTAESAPVGFVDRLWLIAALAAAALLWAPPASATIKVNQEPPTGHLHYGQRLLLDDGSCPTGQIEELVSGRSAKGVKRLRHCVHRSRAREAPRLGA